MCFADGQDAFNIVIFSAWSWSWLGKSCVYLNNIISFAKNGCKHINLRLLLALSQSNRDASHECSKDMLAGRLYPCTVV